MPYKPISEYTDHINQKNELRELPTAEEKINFAWFKLREAVDNKDMKQIRKMYHWVEWLLEKQKTG